MSTMSSTFDGVDYFVSTWEWSDEQWNATAQLNYIQTCTFLWQHQGEISQPRKQSVSFVRHGLGFDPWWSGSLRLGDTLGPQQRNPGQPGEGIQILALDANASVGTDMPRCELWRPLGKCDHLLFTRRKYFSPSLLLSFYDNPWINPPQSGTS